MADKKPTADNWPVVSGDYIVGDPESPVAVTTLASHNEDIPAAAGAAIAGPCKTENLGIEKVVANIISNPNIRFLILCGAEVQGHITGQSIQALHENGCDQVELVDMIDNEDGGAITAKVKECIEKDPGALEEDALVISLDEENSKKLEKAEMSSKIEDVEVA